MKYRLLKWWFGLFLLFVSIAVNAQDAATATAKDLLTPEQYLLIITGTFITVVLFALGMICRVLRVIYNDFIAKGIYKKPVADAFTGMMPMEMEHELLLAHDYDGIQELDNNLPPWWVYMFYASIFFAVAYIWFYHMHGTGNTQADEYRTELAEAEIQQKLMAGKVDESSVKLFTEPEKLANGVAIYTKSCTACHGKKGEGGVGPNLTDDYWLHGGDIKDVFKTVKYGVPAKGMISWQAQLGPVQIQEVSSYVKSLRGTNPPGAKEAQGEVYKE